MKTRMSKSRTRIVTELTEDLLEELNLRYPLKKKGRNDQIVDVQADRPAISIV